MSHHDLRSLIKSQVLTDLATVTTTPMDTRKHPSSWLTLYLLPRKIIDRSICHTRKVCKRIDNIISDIAPIWDYL